MEFDTITIIAVSALAIGIVGLLIFVFWLKYKSDKAKALAAPPVNISNPYTNMIPPLEQKLQYANK